MVPSDFGENRSAGGLPEPPWEKYWATWALVERERGAARAGPRAPSPLVRIGLGEGGRRPPFLLPLPLPFPLLVGVGKRGILLLLGGGFLLLARLTRAGRPPPLLLYIRGQGGTLGHTS